MNALEINVLQVMSTQSTDFLCKADSSCFIAAGIEPVSRVQQALLSLAEQKLIEQFDVTLEVDIALTEKNEDGSDKLDDNGQRIYQVDEEGAIKIKTETELADRGYVLTEKGKTALASA